ncbi:MAG: hypothetical protein WD009_10555 [Phycisphaeraceae bacterium]
MLTQTPVVTIVSLLLGGWLASPAAAAEGGDAPASRQAMVYFEAESSLEEQPGWNAVLAREVMRQAVLLAAREELGLVTRDAVLDEPVPPADRLAGWVMIEARIHGRDLTLRLPHLDPEPAALEARMPGDIPHVSGYRRMVTVVEQWSRDELPARLRAAGFEGRPVRVNPDAVPPAALITRTPALPRGILVPVKAAMKASRPAASPAPHLP